MLNGEKETECDAVGGVKEKAERDRVHEWNVEDVEFLPQSRAIVVVPAEGNAVAGGGVLAHEGRGPANQPEPPGPGQPISLIAAKRKAARKIKT